MGSDVLTKQMKLSSEKAGISAAEHLLRLKLGFDFPFWKERCKVN